MEVGADRFEATVPISEDCVWIAGYRKFPQLPVCLETQNARWKFLFLRHAAVQPGRRFSQVP